MFCCELPPSSRLRRNHNWSIIGGPHGPHGHGNFFRDSKFLSETPSFSSETPSFSLGTQAFYWGPQYKSGFSNEKLGVSNENLWSSIKIWETRMRLPQEYPNVNLGVSDEIAMRVSNNTPMMMNFPQTPTFTSFASMLSHWFIT